MPRLSSSASLQQNGDCWLRLLRGSRDGPNQWRGVREVTENRKHLNLKPADTSVSQFVLGKLRMVLWTSKDPRYGDCRITWKSRGVDGLVCHAAAFCATEVPCGERDFYSYTRYVSDDLIMWCSRVSCLVLLRQLCRLPWHSFMVRIRSKCDIGAQFIDVIRFHTRAWQPNHPVSHRWCFVARRNRSIVGVSLDTNAQWLQCSAHTNKEKESIGGMTFVRVGRLYIVYLRPLPLKGGRLL